MKVKNLFYVAAVIAVCLAFSQVANASLFLTPGGAGLKDGSSAANALEQVLQGGEQSQNQIDDVLDAYFLAQLGFELDECYKQNVGEATDSGDLAGSYTTTYNGDASGFTLSYDGGNVAGQPAYLLVKDGAGVPTVANDSWYLFSLANWDSTEDIIGFNFWPTQGAISHVAIYCEPAAVPEAISFAVWSLLIGSVGLVTARRRRAG
jgi:hypothetical protein